MGRFTDYAAQKPKEEQNRQSGGRFTQYAAEVTAQRTQQEEKTPAEGKQQTPRRTNVQTGEAQARAQRIGQEQQRKQRENAETELSTAKRAEEEARKKYTAAPLVNRGSEQARENTRRAKEELESAQQAVSHWQGEVEKYGGEPTFLDRVLGTVKSGIKQTAAAQTDALGTLYQGGQERRDEVMSDSIEMSRKAWEQQRRTLEDMLAENRATPGKWSDKAIETQRAAVEWTRKQYMAYAGNHLTQTQAGQAARDLALDTAISAGKDLEEAQRGLGFLGKAATEAGASLVQMAGDYAANAALGLNPNAMLPLGFRAFGGGTMAARQDGADLDGQVLYGGAVAAKEIILEKLFNLSLPFRSAYGAGSADDLLQQAIDRAVSRAADRREKGAGRHSQLRRRGTGRGSGRIPWQLGGMADAASIRRGTGKRCGDTGRFGLQLHRWHHVRHGWRGSAGELSGDRPFPWGPKRLWRAGAEGD